MTDARKTGAYVAVAAILAALAWATALRTGIPGNLQDRGEPFFPGFTDPNAATSLEVVEFDEQTSVARPFKVLNRDGTWTIPSRYDHPADSNNRLSSIAAAVIALKKDDIASENIGDQERCGVLDPLDETLPTSQGRGTRITVKGQNDVTLADIIVGKPVEGRPALRYVRLPGQTRTYVARVGDLEASTKFEDWIERNLLQTDREEIDQILIRNYGLDVKTNRFSEREMVTLQKTGPDAWRAGGMAPNEEINSFRMNFLVTNLVELSIIDVRPKPVAITAALTGAAPAPKVTRADLADFESRGFYLNDRGQTLSSEGEVVVHTTSGIFFRLQFGDVATSDSRYLFIQVGFDPTAIGGSTTEEVQHRLALLRSRFAPWYYVISDESFKNIRLERKDLLQPKGTDARKRQREG